VDTKTEVIMMMEKSKKEIAVAIVATTAIWAVLEVLTSALSGPLGEAKGIEIGPWTVGAVSHYWDPFLLGLLVAFAIFAWRHRPKDPFGELIIHVFLLGTLLCIMIYIGEIGGKRSSDIFLFLSALGCLVILPMQFKVIYSLTEMFFLIILGIDLGITTALLLVIGAWLGKWTIWWVHNILWLGTRAAREKLNELRRAEIPPATEL
jgi:hypothetical protein